MHSFFTDSTVLCLCPEATKGSKNVLSLKKSMLLAYTFTLGHGIESCFECLIIPRKVQDCSKQFLRNKNNFNKNIFWKSHQYQ